MGFAVQLVREMTHEMTPPSVTLPVGLLKCFSVVHFVRRIWRYCQWWKKHSNPDNLFTIVADRGFGYLLGENRAVQFGAQCIYILRCLNDCVNGYSKLYRTYLKLTGLIWGYYPTCEDQPWRQEIPSRSIFYSGFHALATSLKNKIVFMKLLAVRIYKLIKSLFKLSMLNMDAVDAFAINASNSKIAVNEVVSNGAQLIEEFSGNVEILVEKLKKNRTFIQKILQDGSIGGTADQLIEYIESTLQTTQKAGSIVKEVSEGIVGVVVFAVKEIAFGIFSTIGISDLMPGWLIPPLCLPSSTPEYQRFIPKELITLKNVPPPSGVQTSCTKIGPPVVCSQIDLSEKKIQRLQTCFTTHEL